MKFRAGMEVRPTKECVYNLIRPNRRKGIITEIGKKNIVVVNFADGKIGINKYWIEPVTKEV